MWGHNPPALLSLLGLMLLWPYVLTTTVSSRPNTTDITTLSADSKQRPHAAKRSTQNCDSTFDNYCLNQGQCMLLVDMNVHHCKCERGFYGPRCAKAELVFQPMAEEQMIVTVFCVCLLLIGLAGALYFCCKRYKKKRLLASQQASGSSRDCLQCLPLTHGAKAGKSNQEFPVS
ncbi:proepiregulin [Cynoglossus semilaevis]|uniref:Epiregulin n=1 Tax=Cynoglossus semilaevis TaxID=244447 RepID=A0A3P8WYJ0_CYNSE|nr:proepiregulin [Cynoglossus semilaevis]